MGFSIATSQITFNYMICTLLFFLLVLLLHTPSSSALISSSSTTTTTSFSASSSSSSSHEIQPQTPSAHSKPTTTTPAQYQVFYSKNTTPFSLDKQEVRKNHKKIVKHHKYKNKKMKRVKRKKTKRHFKTRPFSVMLPKGFVPPSGSSPCHNAYPNSVAFFCDLSPTSTSKP